MQYQRQQQQRRVVQHCAARAAPQPCCVERHLVNRNEMRVSGSDSYALLFLFLLFWSRLHDESVIDHASWRTKR